MIFTKEERAYWFEDLFDTELDSWFASDIACCDHCYDDFIENWPFVYEADNAAFQRSSIDMDSFYHGSLLMNIIQ